MEIYDEWTQPLPPSHPWYDTYSTPQRYPAPDEIPPTKKRKTRSTHQSPPPTMAKRRMESTRESSEDDNVPPPNDDFPSVSAMQVDGQNQDWCEG